MVFFSGLGRKTDQVADSDRGGGICTAIVITNMDCQKKGHVWLRMEKGKMGAKRRRKAGDNGQSDEDYRGQRLG